MKEELNMEKIWANRLVAGTKTWDEVPAARKSGVKLELARRVESGAITEAEYEAITATEHKA